MSDTFLQVSLIGAQAVLYLLIVLSILSVGLIIERAWFYWRASKGLEEFREKVRLAVESARWTDVQRYVEERMGSFPNRAPTDMETGVVSAMTSSRASSKPAATPHVLEELAADSVLRSKIGWEQNLVILATIGSNAPFIGLFGTVLGIIKAFHSLSEQAAGGAGATAVTAGISEALVATAVGILVAIPAVVAFNLFQRRIKSALAETEALKSFLIAKILG